MRVYYLTIPAEVLQANISAEAKLVCAAIRFLANPTGACDAAYREIGAIVGTDKRTVMRVIPELTNAGFVIDFGGGNGTQKRFSVPNEPIKNSDQFNSGTGAESEPVQNSDRYKNGTAPVPKTYRTGTNSVPLYKEEKRNNNNAHVAPDGAQETPSDNNVTSRPRRTTPKEIDPAFEALFDLEVWPLWPRKVARRAAYTALRRLYDKRGAEFVRDTVISAIRVQKANGGRLNPDGGVKFIPHFATWLNGEEWQNESSAVSSDEKPWPAGPLVAEWVPSWEKD
jgi:hypothetical protein